MKYYIDTEFRDDGKCIDLISIGVAAEDGRELYVQSAAFDLQEANPWVKENVLPHLFLCPHVKSHGDTPLEALDANKFEHSQGQCAFEHITYHGSLIAGGYAECYWRTREQMRNEIKAFIIDDEKIEIYGWCCAYDWVAICQLFGTMMDLPKNWPHYMRDIQMLLDEECVDDSELPSQTETAHNALADARYIKQIFEEVL